MKQIILKDVEGNIFLSLGINISKYHHERWDGNGYLEGLEKYQIPLEARIVALVDVYDALISERPYKRPFSKENSVSLIMEGVGIQFDPEISSLFIQMINESNDKDIFGE